MDASPARRREHLRAVAETQKEIDQAFDYDHARAAVDSLQAKLHVSEQQARATSEALQLTGYELQGDLIDQLAGALHLYRVLVQEVEDRLKPKP